MSIAVFFFFFKQKTAYEMRISDWSSDVCSSDLAVVLARQGLDVLVVERHSVGGVTTRGSTGKLSALQGDTILAVAETRSVADAATYAAASAAGVEGLRGLITDRKSGV